MRELPSIKNASGWPGRFLRGQHERPSARHGDPAGLLDDPRQREHTARQFLCPTGVGRLLVEL